MYDIEAKPGFETNKLEKLYSATKQRKYTDVEFIVRGRSIYAHMIVLATCSDIFTSENVEKLNAIFSSYDDVIIDAIVKYCYTGVIYIDEDLYKPFKELAAKLQITNLYYKMINSENCLEAVTLSNDPVSKKIALDVTLRNFKTLYKTPAFSQLPDYALTEILSSEHFKKASEKYILDSIKIWVESDDKKRRPKLKKLLSFAKLPNLIMEANLTEVQSGFYSTSEYMAMINETIDSISRHKITHHRKRREKIALIGSFFGGSNDTIEVFDSKEKKWKRSKEVIFKRTNYASVLVDNWILIIGGDNHSFISLDLVEYIDLRNGVKRPLKPINTKRSFFSAVTVRNDFSTDVYIMGGNDVKGELISSVERWNSKSRYWVYVAEMPWSVHRHSACVIDDKIYITGGIINDPDTKTSNKVLMYSTRSDIWYERASMLEERDDHSSAAIKGILYVAGGAKWGVGTFLDSVEYYDPNADLWTSFNKLPSPRAQFCLFNFRNKLILMGGMNKYNTMSDDVFEYDEKDEKWKATNSLSAPKKGLPLSAFIIPFNSFI